MSLLELFYVDPVEVEVASFAKTWLGSCSALRYLYLMYTP